MISQPHTPTTDLMRQWHVLADHSGNKSTEEYEAEFDRWLATVEAAAEQRGAAPLLKLLEELVDPDDCWFDHHGGCQAHGFISLEPGETCPHQDAKELIRADQEGAQDA